MLAADLRELADEGLGDRVSAFGVLLGVLAPEEAVTSLAEQWQQVDRERGLAQAAQALEHEHAFALAQLAARRRCRSVRRPMKPVARMRRVPTSWNVRWRTFSGRRRQPGGAGRLSGWFGPRW